MKLLEHGAYLLNGTEIIEDTPENAALLTSRLGCTPDSKQARKQTIAYGILEKHNTAADMDQLINSGGLVICGAGIICKKVVLQ